MRQGYVRRRSRLAGLMLATAALAAAIGVLGSLGSRATAAGPIATASIGKAKFLRHGNAICVKRRKTRQQAFNAYVQSHKGHGRISERVLNAATRATFPPGMNAEVAELQKLGAPPGDSGAVDAIEAAFAKSARTAGEVTNAKSKAAFDEVFGKAGKMAKNYGLIECASG